MNLFFSHHIFVLLMTSQVVSANFETTLRNEGKMIAVDQPGNSKNNV